ncbi:DNA polymerase III subunit delta' [Martelella sp. AD-3]|uniref:DNA polymerase III subunit delta' n=1 Tax=Martelella sp. AD-3 TaxID=686597 RepID=UPI00046657C4|nr:DNA polymerase III subunit delta' [Martelella sp. AD-3]AMM84457.1 DNA polymerase III subunit delta' [Martelella sp. AD-3]
MADELLLEGAVEPSRNRHLFGHGEAEAYLAQSYRGGKGHHALLLEGAAGIGKATLAFRFANHVLHFPHPADAPDHLIEPDQTSPLTRQIIAGASHDLLHLKRPVDAKSGKLKTAITVEEVRRAGHFLSQTSGTGNWRIVIVDAADDLNRNAANAILKILEEPPKNAMFLLISHAPGRLLPTIRSRCLPLRLRPLAAQDLAAALGALGLSAGGQDEERMAALANGSVAEALKLVNYGGLEIIDAYDAVLEGTVAEARLVMHKLADTVAKRENETIFDFLLGHIDGDIKTRAREAAFSGDLPLAERLAGLSSRIAADVAEADAYNLDRRQLALDLLSRLRTTLEPPGADA